MNKALWYGGDTISISVLVTTLMGWLPTAAAVLTVVWGLIRLWETCTVQQIVRGVKLKCAAHFEPSEDK